MKEWYRHWQHVDPKLTGDFLVLLFTDFGTLPALFSDQFTVSSAFPELVSSCMKVLRLGLFVQKCIFWRLDANDVTLVVANCWLYGFVGFRREGEVSLRDFEAFAQSWWCLADTWMYGSGYSYFTVFTFKLISSNFVNIIMNGSKETCNKSRCLDDAKMSRCADGVICCSPLEYRNIFLRTGWGRGQRKDGEASKLWLVSNHEGGSWAFEVFESRVFFSIGSAYLRVQFEAVLMSNY